MGEAERGVVAAGHPLTAQAGASVLREGGNAVDATVAAMLTSFVTESLLTGLGAGGYMLVAGGGHRADAARLLRGRRRRASATARRPSCAALTCPSATPSRCSTSGRPRAASTGRRRACARRFADGAPSRSRISRRLPRGSRATGVVLNAGQAYVAEILVELLTSTPESAALWAPDGQLLREGEAAAQPRAGGRADAPGARRRRAVLPWRHRDVGVRLAERARVARCARRTSRATPRSSVSRSRSPTATARSSPTRRHLPAARCSPTRSRCSTAGPRRRRCDR